ncbi:cytochrome c [Sphaerotilus hippei]|uniref:Cytochrome c n=1 Tax=Sphaerotilus hippei TaxID=744406 RepID=A0A318H017_9BURK|nr:c-type cytochrome [Sphaerotilus hippei]PXW96139.1 cytochrome c [Sphaerotilus hippei]
MTRMIPRLSRQRLLPVLGLALALGATAASADGRDDAMLKLASQSGCMTCHHIEPGGKGPQGLAPIGPAWRSVAAKYKGDGKAQDTLTTTVLKGSNPYDSHWKGQASGLAMPPNAVAIQAEDAKALVQWILQLGPR